MRIVMIVHVPSDNIICVGGMRHGFVAAVFCMFVAGLVPRARVATGTSLGISGRRFHDVFVDMAVVHEVEVAVVEIIGMSGVSDLGVGACRAMLVRVPAVHGVFHTSSIP
jgi:hypothetical protein